MKKLKIFLMISILLCFGFALSTEVHASGPKLFEVGDVLPATTRLRISWADMTASGGYDFMPTPSQVGSLKSNNNSFQFFTESGDYFYLCGIPYYNTDYGTYISPYTGTAGDHPYMDIDTSEWSLGKRTISSYVNSGGAFTYNLTWEDLNAPSGYTITYNSNGGTIYADITEATELPTPLPTPTKEGSTFVNWYYDSAYTQIAIAGDPIESDVTLYALWRSEYARKKIFEVGDLLSPGQIKISWDFSEITISEDDYIRIEGTNDFAIYMAVEDVANSVEMSIMGYYTDIVKGHIMINLDSIAVITEIKSDGNSDYGDILDALSWEYIGEYQEGYNTGYAIAREDYGYYDPSTDEWLTVTEYINRYGTDKMNQTDFYNNFDKYFIPAMIIVFGGAIVLTILKVFNKRE